MKCKKCKVTMKDLPQSFDVFSFLPTVKPMYCNNNECERYGDVTVVGLPEEPEELLELDRKEV